VAEDLRTVQVNISIWRPGGEIFCGGVDVSAQRNPSTTQQQPFHYDISLLWASSEG
jgi:hypothetical protein